MPDRNGSLSPITTSSSQHKEDDKSIEYYVKGGENDMDKTNNNIGVTSSPDDSYSVPDNATTEPDADGKLAMTKGEGCCENCTGEECGGSCCKSASCGMKKADMTKACSCCEDCDADCSGGCCDKCTTMDKATDQQVDDDKQEEMQKSIWGNAFSPLIPTNALRTVFKFED